MRYEKCGASESSFLGIFGFGFQTQKKNARIHNLLEIVGPFSGSSNRVKSVRCLGTGNYWIYLS
jgi:hypothetical protein